MQVNMQCSQKNDDLYIMPLWDTLIRVGMLVQQNALFFALDDYGKTQPQMSVALNELTMMLSLKG